MTIKLLDYARNPVEVDVGDIDTIGAMSIEVVTGDEILTVIRKDCSLEKYDSSHSRSANFADGYYIIYNAAKGFSLLDCEEFANRQSSYWFYNTNWEEP